IADDEQSAWFGRDAPPIGSWLSGAQPQQDFRLQRIGVLKLVDEKVREARVKRAAHARVSHEQVARAQQQIHEVERARAALQRFVAGDHAAELLAQQRREVAIGGALKRVELVRQGFVGGPDLVAGQVWSV